MHICRHVMLPCRNRPIKSLGVGCIGPHVMLPCRNRHTQSSVVGCIGQYVISEWLLVQLNFYRLIYKSGLNVHTFKKYFIYFFAHDCKIWLSNALWADVFKYIYTVTCIRIIECEIIVIPIFIIKISNARSSSKKHNVHNITKQPHEHSRRWTWCKASLNYSHKFSILANFHATLIISVCTCTVHYLSYILNIIKNNYLRGCILICLRNFT